MSQFYSSIWNQINHIVILVNYGCDLEKLKSVLYHKTEYTVLYDKNELKYFTEFKLFEKVGSGMNYYYSPRSNDQIENFIKRIMKIKMAMSEERDHDTVLIMQEENNWREKIKKYYRGEETH